jgi:hypothetical protein
MLGAVRQGEGILTGGPSMADSVAAQGTPARAPPTPASDPAAGLPPGFEKMGFLEKSAALGNMLADQSPRLPADTTGDPAYHARPAAIERQQGGKPPEAPLRVQPAATKPRLSADAAIDEFVRGTHEPAETVAEPLHQAAEGDAPADAPALDAVPDAPEGYRIANTDLEAQINPDAPGRAMVRELDSPRISTMSDHAVLELSDVQPEIPDISPVCLWIDSAEILAQLRERLYPNRNCENFRLFLFHISEGCAFKPLPLARLINNRSA